jgi:hypothetical protein
VIPQGLSGRARPSKSRVHWRGQLLESTSTCPAADGSPYGYGCTERVTPEWHPFVTLGGGCRSYVFDKSSS